MSISTRIGVQWQEPADLLLDLPDGRRLRCAGVPREVAAEVADLDVGGVPDAAEFDPTWRAWLRAVVRGDIAAAGRRWQPLIALYGCGPLGAAVAGELAAAGCRRLLLVDDTAAVPAALAGATRAETLRAELAAAGHGEVHSARLGDGTARARVDLAVCLRETAEADRDLTDALLRGDVPHLVTSFVGSAAVVGPLVVPGATACVRCGDLAAVAADPGWVQLLAARTRRAVSLTPPVRGWLVTTIVQQILAWRAHGRPETLGATLELDTDDWLLRTRPGKVNATCGCRDQYPGPMHNGGHGSATPP